MYLINHRNASLANTTEILLAHRITDFARYSSLHRCAQHYFFGSGGSKEILMGTKLKCKKVAGVLEPTSLSPSLQLSLTFRSTLASVSRTPDSFQIILISVGAAGSWFTEEKVLKTIQNVGEFQIKLNENFFEQCEKCLKIINRELKD